MSTHHDEPEMRFTGEIISIGDLPAVDAPVIIGRPHIMLRVPDHTAQGRIVLISGLTIAECRDVSALFLEQATVSIFGGQA